MPAHPSSRESFQPLLHDQEVDAANAVVKDIADALARPEWNDVNYGLAGGNAGLAVFYDEVYRALSREEDRERRDHRWNRAIDQVAEDPMPGPNLYSGYPGVGWASLRLTEMDGSGEDPGGAGDEHDTNAVDAADDTDDTDDAYEDFDVALLDHLESIAVPADYDLINGPVGWALYALDRWPHPRAHRALELVVDYLEASATTDERGVRWHTHPAVLPAWQREKFPDGYYNLGLAHGCPGVWVVLAQARARGIRRDTTARLLDGSISWGLSQRIDGAEGLAFPTSVAEGHAPSPSRLAWCYGDLGIAAALLVTARCVGHVEWEAEALAIARNAARVTGEASAVVDAGLCHGAAGAGHIFNRMSQCTGDEMLREAGRHWLRQALTMRDPETGLAGYLAWQPMPGRMGADAWVPVPGLLEGSSGIALALLGGCQGHEPWWDQWLFVSSVPVPAVLDSTAGTAPQ